MAFNWAGAEAGSNIVDFSSEVEGCEAFNVQVADHSSIWLTKNDSLPQWLCLSLANVFTTEDLVLRTIGWHCWHPYTTNPKTVNVHVSCDGQKFRVWDTLHAPMLQGTQLFTTAAINVRIYPYIALEILETHGGNQTYMNRIFLYTDEVPPSPAPRHLHAQSRSSSESAFQAALSEKTGRRTLSPPREGDEDIETVGEEEEDADIESRLRFGSGDSFDAVLRPHDSYLLVSVSPPPPSGAVEATVNPFEANPFDNATLLCESLSPDGVFRSAVRRVESPIVSENAPRQLAIESPPPSPEVTASEAATLAARIAKLESTSAQILWQLQGMPAAPHAPSANGRNSGDFTRDSKADSKDEEVEPAVMVVLQDIRHTVQQALIRVEQRHSAFIEGFSMAAGRSLYSETVYSPEKSVIREEMPLAPNLELLRSRCGVGTTACVSAKKTRRPLGREVSASSASSSNTRGVPTARNAQADHDVALLALRLSVAVHHRQQKEAQLRSLIEKGTREQGAGRGGARMQQDGTGSVSRKILHKQTRW